MRRALPTALRRRVLVRAGRRCEYCKSLERFSPDSFSIDHITPLSEGGGDEQDNLAFSCQGCNASKQSALQAYDTQTDTIVALFHPRQQLWADHFEWSGDFLFVIGTTPMGRATVVRLQLNRDGVVNLRRVLLMIDEDHPPSDAGTQ